MSVKLRDWRLKALVQKSLGVLPYGSWVNDRLQKTIGGLRSFDLYIDSKVITDWSFLVSHMKGVGVPVADRVFLELGSGWIPILPICFSLIGAKNVLTLDIQELLNAKWTFRALRHLKALLGTLVASSTIPTPDIGQKYDRLVACKDLSELFDKACIEYHSPIDTTQTGFPTASVDVIFSNGVLQLIPVDIVRAIMRESYRLLRPGGIIIHSIGCGDQYAHWDPRITAINFLQYSESEWKFWNSPFLYQSRMRAPDYLNLAEQVGFHVLSVKRRSRPDLEALVPKMKIDPAFSAYSFQDLCCTSMDFIAQRP